MCVCVHVYCVFCGSQLANKPSFHCFGILDSVCYWLPPTRVGNPTGPCWLLCYTVCVRVCVCACMGDVWWSRDTYCTVHYINVVFIYLCVCARVRVILNWDGTQFAQTPGHVHWFESDAMETDTALSSFIPSPSKYYSTMFNITSFIFRVVIFV